MIQKGDWPQQEWCWSNSCDPKHWTILLPKMYSAEQNRRSRKLQKRKGCKETHKICINFTHLFSTLRWIKSNVQCYYNMLQLLMKHSCQKQQQGFKSFLSCANTCIKQLIFGMIFFFPSVGSTPTFGVWTFVRSRIMKQQYQFWYKITKSTFTLLKQSTV